jgi:hypothetical protein
LAPLPLLGVDEIRKIAYLHFLLKFNLLADYEKEKETPLIYVLLFQSYVI